MFDDFSGLWGDAPMDSPPIDYPAMEGPGAFDQWGSAAGATGPGTNPGDTIFGGNAANPFGASSGFPLADWMKKYGPSGLNFLTANDGALLRMFGNVGAAGVGAFASNRQANSLSALSDRYMNMGAPSRARYESTYTPGFSMSSDPGYSAGLEQATKSALHRASVNGNPFGSPNAQAQTLADVNANFTMPALQSYRTGNANAGGISTFNAAAPGAAAGAIDARNNVWNAAGAATYDVLNPRDQISLEDLQSLAAARKLQGLT